MEKMKNLYPSLKTLIWALFSNEVSAFVVSTTHLNHQHALQTTQLKMSLKPAAIPLMDSGKALARSGEFIVDMTNGLEIYGGALSASGAFIRNAGDCVAQAAASCRFKTAAELVCDELREGGTCLQEATNKLKLAVEEAETDKNEALAQRIQLLLEPIQASSIALEAAGRGIMQRIPLTDIGESLVECGKGLEKLSAEVGAIAQVSDAASNDASMAGQRMTFAAQKMVEAGNELKGIKPDKPKGRAFLKG